VDILMLCLQAALKTKVFHLSVLAKGRVLPTVLLRGLSNIYLKFLTVKENFASKTKQPQTIVSQQLIDQETKHWQHATYESEVF
jgi:hypothetical protein